MRRLNFTAAFSLVELTLALGVAGFCLIAIFALMPVGVQTNRNATSQTAAANILSSVVSDIRASPKGHANSAKYGIRRSLGNTTTLYFDGQGQFTTSPGANSRYRLYAKIYPTIAQPLYLATYAYLKVTWPAAVDPLNSTVPPSGSLETVATYFEN